MTPNIETVVNNGLCTQCGACASACPHGNIHIRRDDHWRYVPEVTEPSLCREKCGGLCRDICGGLHEDYNLWPPNQFSGTGYQEWCTGKVREVRIGYATDPGIRERGSSGGVVTGLLVYLLETGLIDGALVIGPYDPEHNEHRPFIARSRQELESAWGSKYYPMPLGKHFKEMMNGEERYAVVLMGCHMRSLRLMEQRFPRLKDNILLRIGLICGYCSGFKAVEDQAREWGIKEVPDIEALDYRKGPWPGNFCLKAGNIEKERVIYEFLLRLPFTTNQRCMVCADLMNETSDITVGDAWLGELTEKRDAGWSVAAARNTTAADLLRKAQESGYLHLRESDLETFARSQEKPMRYKKYAFRTRLDYVSKKMKTSVPEYDLEKIDVPTPIDRWNRRGNRLFLLTLRIFFKRDRLRRFVFRWAPSFLLHRYIRFIFAMIAHDGQENFLRKHLSRKRQTVLNCDA